MYRRRSSYRMARRLGYGASGGMLLSMAVTIATLVAVAWYSLPIVLAAVVGTFLLLYSIKWGCWLFLWVRYKMFPHWRMSRGAYRELYKLASLRLLLGRIEQ